ncbi:hypothetical protein [Streptomyces sp. H27-H5]|uniref:hypothetical protein n=1 Tax=Streptomyces sp. H27-H5 TaxID=2996460 RepID=UPI00226F4E20|nr:hypothetical protein [Streptomyces sp. H27-H5]MCY0960828.1 hypothetical protein [Streptomyces sp. H27-H5]
MPDYRVSGYTTTRGYHLDQPDYTVIVRDDPDLEPVADRARKVAREVAAEVRSLRRFRIAPVMDTRPPAAPSV